MSDESHPRRRDAARTRIALLGATRRLLTEHGANGVSTRMIAQEVGVNQALVYRYFGSKEALINEAIEVRSPDLHEAISAAPIEELGRVFVEQVIAGTDGSSSSGLALFVAASDNDGVRAQLRDTLEALFGDALGAKRGIGADAGLRGELIGAVAVGVSVMRTMVGTSALRAASPEELLPYVQRVIDVLLKDVGTPLSSIPPDHGAQTER